MAKYQKYAEYKDSGVDWLGEIPSHWEILPVGRLFTRLKRTGFPKQELLSVYRDYGVIPKSSRDDNNNKPSDDLGQYQLVKPNDLVMNKMKAWQGSIAISEYEGIVSPAYFVYQPLKNLFAKAFPKYVHYLLRNPRYIAQYLRRSKGIRVNQWDLDPEEFQRIELVLPPKSEQDQIFNFLDHETAKIDSLIAKQEKLIELLKEKRQAVISHAVTKGLNPDVNMKDSGVEWLGQVPEHWEILKFDYAINTVSDIDHYMPNSVDEGIPYVMTGDLQDFVSDIDFESCKKVAYLDYQKLSRKIKTTKDDIIFARYATIGTLSYVDIDKEFLVSYSCVTIKSNPLRTTGKYLSYYLKSQAFLQAIQQQINSNTQGNVGVDSLRNVKMILPLLSEQEAIIEFLKVELSTMDNLIDKAQSAIQLMQERRTALISSAVTGKIDVRNWQNPNHNNNEANTELGA